MQNRRDTGQEPITHGDDLLRVCRRLAEAGAFAVDMEFESERSYWPRLHLVQVAVDDAAYLIDPQAFRDLSPLLDLLVDPAIRKITHAGRQDAEIVYHRAGGPPRNWFDTQIAAALLGMGEQVGYAALAGRIVGARIKKVERVTDWSVRPLSPAQIQYALDDVIHLPELARRLDRELEKLDRTAWMADELAFYEDEETYRRDPENAWRRVSGRGQLDRRGLGLLRELARWREEEAARRDEPRGRVVSDPVLVEIAQRQPEGPDDLRPLRRLHHRELERSGRAIVEAVRRGVNLPEDALPVIVRGEPDDPALRSQTQFLDVLVRMRADEHAIAPSYLASQQCLRELAEWLADGGNGEPRPLVLTGWRARLVGEELVELWRGRTSIRMDPRTRRPKLEA